MNEKNNEYVYVIINLRGVINMLEQLFAAIVSLGSSGAQNLLNSVGENVRIKFTEKLKISFLKIVI